MTLAAVEDVPARVARAPAVAPPPPDARGWDGFRVAGIVVLLVMAGLVFALFRFLWISWDPTFFDRFGARYLDGLWITLQLVAGSIVLGGLIAVPVTAARMSDNVLARYGAKAYIGFFRGTPLLAQLFLIYYGLGQFYRQLDAVGLWQFFREPWFCALFVFAIHTAAYQSEILRGAIRSVARGQWEGAAALGIRRARTFRSVILPQAMIVALRPYGNEIVLMTKASALVAIITVLDVFGQAQKAYSRTFDFQAYIWAAFIYLGIVLLLETVWNRFERRLTRHINNQG